ncbi:hypothetical protein N9240_01500, partial [Akkermansiaceae bacterium]|nr:hypothetical protein [Akkermansiaceae bacterium]
QDSTPLMVFDEIDANVGGEIARAVGIKMASLGERHQVVSITHFPQVAAVAHQHFVVEKRVEGGRSLSSLTEVSGEGRIDELVRMLGGGGDSAREMAKSLLNGRDLMGELGLAPGPHLGKILRAVQTEQLEGRLTDREQALAFVKTLPTNL